MTVTLDRHRLEILVLARLATKAKKALTAGSLTKALSPFLERQLSPVEQRTHIDRALEQVAQRGEVTARPLRLTDAGRQRVREFFGIDRDLDWKILRKHYVTATALGLAPTDKVRKRIADKNGLRAGVLWRHHGLPHAAPPTLNQAVDALVWRQLGVDTDAPLTLARVRAHFLTQMLGSKRALSNDKLQQLAAARAARSDGLSPEHLRLGLARDWLFPAQKPEQTPDQKPDQKSDQKPEQTPDLIASQEPTRTQDKTPDPVSARQPEPQQADAPTPLSLESLASEVTAIASTVDDDGRFGERKVFISAIWQRLRARPIARDLTLDSFKGLLLQANRAELLRLHRADLVSAMPTQHVSASETRYLNAAFHFVESVPMASVEPIESVANSTRSTTRSTTRSGQ